MKPHDYSEGQTTKPDEKWKPQNIIYQGHIFSSQP